MDKMKNNWMLFLGISLLIIGVLLRALTDLTQISSILLALGIFLKILYLLVKIRDRSYKPGLELSALIIGLLLFFSGRYLGKQEIEFYPILLMVTGILLKIGFVILIIRKIRGQIEVT